ncbi:hypothetical protein SCA6_017409 [Theobroma cacao]
MKGGGGGGGGGVAPAKRRWRGLAIGVLFLVVLSMLVPLGFLLGLHNGFHSAGAPLSILQICFFFSSISIRASAAAVIISDSTHLCSFTSSHLICALTVSVSHTIRLASSAGIMPLQHTSSPGDRSSHIDSLVRKLGPTLQKMTYTDKVYLGFFLIELKETVSHL